MSYTRLTLAVEDVRPHGDRYLTPPWVLRWFLRSSGWTPMGDLIWDPACGGVRGWTIGAEIPRSKGQSLWLSDLEPATRMSCGHHIDRFDFLRSSVPVGSKVSHITNPPYSILEEWIAKAREESEEVVLLVPLNKLFSGVHRMKGLTDVWVPLRRIAFGLDDETARVRQEMKARDPKVGLVESPTSITGWGMPSTGEAHGWARWVKGYTGPARLHPPTKPTKEDLGQVDDRTLSLFGGGV